MKKGYIGGVDEQRAAARTTYQPKYQYGCTCVYLVNLTLSHLTIHTHTYTTHTRLLTHSPTASSKAGSKTRSINELLKKALESASEAGEGDEAPEVLPAPSHDQRGLDADATAKDGDEMGDEDEDDDLERAYTAGAGSKSESKRAEGKRAIDDRGEPGMGMGMGTKSTRRVEDIREEKARAAMEEEERRVAALTFDDDALLPFDDMRERAKYIPLRLSYEERKVWGRGRVIQAQLHNVLCCAVPCGDGMQLKRCSVH